VDKKVSDLLEAALTNTRRGQLQWQAFNAESFRTRIGSGSLHIQRVPTQVSSDGTDVQPAVAYAVQIADGQGRVVAEEEVIEHNLGSTLLQNVFEAARKSALGTATVLDEMLNALRGE
jgi:hypothetical protein